MSQTVTVATLITRVRDRIDRPIDDGFITDTEITRYLDSAYKWLYNLLASKGLGQYESSQDISTDGSTTYTLNSAFFGVIGVDVQVSSELWSELPRIQIADRNKYLVSTSGFAEAYRIYNGVIQFYPTPPSGQTYRVYYIPVAGTLDDTADSVDGVNGFEELMVIEAAIRCMMKEESSTSGLERERALWIEHIDAMAETRISESPNKVIDNEWRASRDPADWLVWR